MIDEKALLAAQRATTTAGQRGDLKSAPVPLHVLKAALEAYESAKPKDAVGLKLGSRLTVEGVEAVVVPHEPTEHMLNSGACYHDPQDLYGDQRRSRRFDEGESVRDIYRAMLSAAGDKE